MTSTVLVVGATGGVGRHVVPESLRRGHLTRALVRQRSDGQSLPADADVVVGDLSDATTLAEAVDGVDAVAFPPGSHGGAADAEAGDYGAVRNVLLALGSRRVRIFVDDFDARVAGMAERGLEPAKRETYANGVRKATHLDPDGNEIGFGGASMTGGTSG